MGVIMTNNYDFRLGSNETVTMNMGRAHRNQLYRPLLLTTKDGIATYLNDSDVPSNLLKRTDWNGNLTFNTNDILVWKMCKYQVTSVSGYQSGLRLTKTHVHSQVTVPIAMVKFTSLQQPLIRKSCMKLSQTSKLLRTISQNST